MHIAWQGYCQLSMSGYTRYVYVDSKVKQGLQEQPRANKREFLNHIRMCRREGVREGYAEGGPAMSALPVCVLEAGVQACAVLSSTHL